MGMLVLWMAMIHLLPRDPSAEFIFSTMSVSFYFVTPNSVGFIRIVSIYLEFQSLKEFYISTTSCKRFDFESTHQILMLSLDGY